MKIIKRKSRPVFYLIVSIFEVIIGLLAIISFLMLTLSGENIARWVLAFITAILLTISGIVGIIEFVEERK